MNTDEIIAKGIKASTAKGRGLYSLIPTIMLVMTVSLLFACGGGSSSPATSESVVARGVITQLGSIWVNGVEYETPKGGSYSSGDNPIDPASYEVGQVVNLRGRLNDDSVSGIADEVEYEAEIKGTAGPDNVINGVTIITDIILVIGTRYEVSGFWLNENTIEATFIKIDNEGFDEVKGIVQAPNSDPLALTVLGVTYTYSGIPVVSIGDLVEIHFNPANKIASRVELEDDFFDNLDDGQKAEREGAVNMDPTDLAACPTGAKFLIGPTCIDWDSVPSDGWMDGLTDNNDMMSGLRVEAEGHFNADGLLIAEKIKGRGNRVRISAFASNIGSDTFDVFGGAIQITTRSGLTSIEDILIDGDGFEIRGIRTDATSPTVLALRIKSDNSVDSTKHRLRAKVDINGVDSSSPNIVTVMGISSQVGPSTKLEDEDTLIAPGNGTAENVIDDFLKSIDDDGIVNTTNGPNDVIDVRIDTSSGDGSFGSPYAAKQIEIEREDD